MTLAELIKKLQYLEEQYGDLQVFSLHGASGITTALSSPSVAIKDEWDNGDTLDMDDGDMYVSIYAGN